MTTDNKYPSKAVPPEQETLAQIAARIKSRPKVAPPSTEEFLKSLQQQEVASAAPTPAPNLVLAAEEQPAPAVQQLSPAELQEIRRVIEQSKLVQEDRERKLVELPELPITDIDKDKFADMLLTGEPFIEEFSRMGGKLRVSFRNRTRAEEEEIIAQIQKDFADGLIVNDAVYVARLNLYNLVAQTVAINGVQQVPDKALDVRTRALQSVYGSMAEPRIYILSCILVQFETKLTKLCREAVKEGFSTPATDS